MDISSSAKCVVRSSALMVASLAKKAADPGRRIRTETMETAAQSAWLRRHRPALPRKQDRYPRLSDKKPHLSMGAFGFIWLLPVRAQTGKGRASKVIRSPLRGG